MIKDKDFRSLTCDQSNEVGSGRLGHQGTLVTLTREVHEALESEQLLGGVTAGQLAHEAVKAAVRGQETEGELWLGGQSPAEVTELADGQLATLAKVGQGLCLLV